MNAENYVKAFQGIVGVYGLQFLLVPKKILRPFFKYHDDGTFYRLMLHRLCDPIRSNIPFR